MNLNFKQIGENVAVAFQNVADNGYKQYYSFEVDMSTMVDFSNADIRKSESYKELFTTLLDFNGPVVYVFEIITERDTRSAWLIDALLNYKSTEGSKSIPALKYDGNHVTDYLYVGKVKKQFWGRLIMHLGFYKVNATQGLQLYHWAKDLHLKLKVHVYEFENEMRDYLEIIETGVAKQLKPLIGKHK